MEPVTVELAWADIPFSASLPSNINAAWVDALSAVGTPLTLAPGKSIIEEDEENVDQGFLVLSGSYSVQKGGAPPLLKEGAELLGEMSRFNPEHKRTAQVQVRSEVSVIMFDWNKVFLALAERLSEEDIKKLHHAFEQYAWEHFTDN